MDSVSDKISKVLSNIEKVLNEGNQEQFALLLKQTADFMNKMDQMIDKKSINHFHNILENSNNITYKIDNFIPKLETLVTNTTDFENNLTQDINSITKSYLSVRAAMNEIEKAMASGDFNFKDMTKDTIPHLNNTLIEMESLMLQLKESLKSYNRSPADIIFKTEEIKKGPGE